MEKKRVLALTIAIFTLISFTCIKNANKKEPDSISGSAVVSAVPASENTDVTTEKTTEAVTSCTTSVNTVAEVNADVVTSVTAADYAAYEVNSDTSALVTTINDVTVEVNADVTTSVTTVNDITDEMNSDDVTAVTTTDNVTEEITADDVATSAVTSESETVTTKVRSEIHGVINGEPIYYLYFCEYDLADNPYYYGAKTYEPYDSITAQSRQLLLQKDALTDFNGFRMLDGRYLVAVGTFCNAPCGTYIDLLLENGTLIPCIVGDIKSDADTDEETHTYTRFSMCASEFIIDEMFLPSEADGNISRVYPEWNSKVKTVRVYCKNYFDM